MKSSFSEKVVYLFSMLVLFSLGGCYTVLMDPSLLTSSDDERFVSTQSDASDTTLDYRYYDAQNTGSVSVPEMSFDPYGWQFPATSLPWWYEAVAPVPPTAVGVSSSSAAGSGQHRRTTGSTRGSDQSTPDIHTSTTVTTTTTTITAPPPPAATAAPTTGTTTERSRTPGNNSAAPAPATRKTGSNRGDGRD